MSDNTACGEAHRCHVASVADDCRPATPKAQALDGRRKRYQRVPPSRGSELERSAAKLLTSGGTLGQCAHLRASATGRLAQCLWRCAALSSQLPARLPRSWGWHHNMLHGLQVRAERNVQFLRGLSRPLMSLRLRRPRHAAVRLCCTFPLHGASLLRAGGADGNYAAQLGAASRQSNPAA